MSYVIVSLIVWIVACSLQELVFKFKNNVIIMFYGAVSALLMIASEGLIKEILK